MKLRLFIAVLILFLSQIAYAATVDEHQAYQRAVKCLTRVGVWQRGELRLIDISREVNYENLYVYVVEGGHGFAVVPKWECGSKVVAYSAENDFVLPMPASVKLWFDGCDKAVGEYKYKNIKAAKDDADEPYSAVGPLLGTQWSQKPLYNNECPMYGTTRCVTGCMATAMAQVMRYWRYPAMGQGTHSYEESNFGTLTVNYGAATYNWNNMPRVLNGHSSVDEVAEVAKLMYHSGVSVNMAYGTGASGTMTSYVPIALRDYFRYDAGVHEIVKDTIEDRIWDIIMYGEIASGRPVIYSGSNQEDMGHAFVLDGYDNTGSYHVNWGWCGNFDGYYAIGGFNPTGSGTGGNTNNDYNYYNSAIVGIQPAADVLTLTVPRTNLSRWGDTLICWMRTGASLDEWTIEDDANGWITIDAPEADERKLVRFAVVAQRNTTGTARTATVTVRHGSEVVTAVLTQEDSSPSADGCYGNQAETYTSMAQIMPGEMFIIRPEALGNFVTGQKVVSFSFGTGSYASFNGRRFNIEIYEGSEYSESLDATAVDGDGAQNIGTKVYSQSYTATEDGVHEVQFDVPYSITSGRNFWIAVRTIDTTVFFIDHVYMHDSIDSADFPVVDSLPKEYLIYRAATTEGDTGLMIYYSYFSQSGVNLLQYGVLPHIFFCVESDELPVCEDVHDTIIHEFCSSYLWEDVEYSVAQSFSLVRSGTVTGGCDSVIIDTFALRSNYVVQQREATCDTMLPFVWRDTSMMDASTYHFVYGGENGCDTDYYLQLVIDTCVPEVVSSCEDVFDTLRVSSSCGYYDYRGTRFYSNIDEDLSSVLDSYTVAGAIEGGCDSVYVIFIRESYIDLSELIDSMVCSDVLPFLWGDSVAYRPGVYYASFPNSNSIDCDSVIAVRLNVEDCVPSECEDVQESVVISACDSVVWNDSLFVETGVYTVIAEGAANGCDSIYAVDVTIMTSPQRDTLVSVCDSAWLFDSLYRVTDDYRFILSSDEGCDTVLTLTLHVRNSSTVVYEAGSCGEYVWHERSYSETGVYTWLSPQQNIAGCDSIEELHLIVGDDTTVETEIMVCDSMLWHGIMLNTDGAVVRAVLPSVAGCDSLVVASVVLRHTSRGYESAEASGSYVWHGHRLFFSGVTYDTLVNAEGCDSVIAFDLMLRAARQGSLNGIFEVAEGRKVLFSAGNLQYMPAGDAWRFAVQQFDVIGIANSNTDSAYVGWIDLYGWATSGYHNPSDIYNVHYMPYSTMSCSVSEANGHGYGPSVTMRYPDLVGTSISYDWGVHNAISNGGNVAGRWRTLTADEWQHLLFERAEASSNEVWLMCLA